MKFNADYTIQVCQFYPTDLHGIMIRDNDTGQYLNQEALEEWIQYVGGHERKVINKFFTAEELKRSGRPK